MFYNIFLGFFYTFLFLLCFSVVLYSFPVFFPSFSLIYFSIFKYISISTLLFCYPVFFPFYFILFYYYYYCNHFYSLLCFLALFFSWHTALVVFLGYVFLLVWMLIVWFRFWAILLSGSSLAFCFIWLCFCFFYVCVCFLVSVFVCIASLLPSVLGFWLYAFVFFNILFSTCYHWRICFLVWLVSSFFPSFFYF